MINGYLIIKLKPKWGKSIQENLITISFCHIYSCKKNKLLHKYKYIKVTKIIIIIVFELIHIFNNLFILLYGLNL